MAKAPVSYDDWKRIYHRELKGLGMIAHTYFRSKRARITPDPIHVPVVRSVWRRVQRLDRIREQLRECWDRMDVTLVEAIARHFGGPE